jgi:hypothetical protein
MFTIDELQTIESAASTLRLAPSTLKRWLRQGRIHGHTLNTAQWCNELDFASTQPSTYYRVREVLVDADCRKPTRRSPLSELLEPVAYIELSR